MIVRPPAIAEFAEGTNARGRSRIGRLSPWTQYLSIPLVATTLLTVWLVSGVAVGDILKFVAFEAFYVVLPGCLLYVLLGSNPQIPQGRLRVLAIGWPLGYALEIGTFALTAALHARGVFTFYPLPTSIAFTGGIFLHRRRTRSGPLAAGALRRLGDWRKSHLGVESLLGAIAIAIVLVMLAVRSFAVNPLPEHATSAFYFVDNVWDISLAAEALHHWPIVESYIAGHPIRYYVGVFIHVAALKQVTGVSIATAIFRLLPAEAIVVAMLQFWCLGGLLGRSRWAGPITVALLIVVENMRLYPTHTKVFGVALFSEFAGSPTYAFGLIFLLGLLILLRVNFFNVGTKEDTIKTSGSMRPGAFGSLILLGILVLGAGAVKTTAVATFVAGLGLFWLWRLVRGRVDRVLSYCLAVSLACFAAIYFLLLSGTNAPAATETELAPFDLLKYTIFKSIVASHPGVIPLVGAAIVITLWKGLPVAAGLWALWRRKEWSPYWTLALAVFAVGFVVYVLMGSPAGNESYFIWYGYIPLIPVATVTLMALWREAPENAHGAIARIAVIVLAVGLVTASVTEALSRAGALTGARQALWYGAILVLVGSLVVLGSSKLVRRLPRSHALRGIRTTVCCLLLLGVLGCAEAVVVAAPDAWRTTFNRQAVPRDSASQPGMTAPLYRGLTWVRDHTDRCVVLAVSPPEIRSANGATERADSGYFYYSAFTEREVFFESWVMTIEGQHGEQPFPARYALNDAATRRGNRAALGELERRGVGYVLLDKIHGADARTPTGKGNLVFSNSALDVYRLAGPVAAHGC